MPDRGDGLRIAHLAKVSRLCAAAVALGYAVNPAAAVKRWSHDRGVGGQARGRLALLLASDADAVCNGTGVDEIYREPRRPQFHFSAARNWINDPNGLVYFDGEYHMFFQHNPTEAKWGNMAWGHAVSKDLLHWEQINNAMEQDSHCFIFSGSSVVDKRNTSGFQRDGEGPPMVAFYTCSPRYGGPTSQRLAVSQDRGRHWTKEPEPVIPSLVQEGPGHDARDPKVMWHEPSQQWVMILWVEKGVLELFGSKELRQWRRLSNITFGGAYECPDLFELPVAGEPDTPKRWVAMAADSTYVVGTFDGTTFQFSDAPQKVEFGQAYASQTWNDEPQGKRIQISWIMQDGGDSIAGPFQGVDFVGVMGFPVELELVRLAPGEPLVLRRRPIDGLATLRLGPPLAIPQQPPAAVNDARHGSGHAAAKVMELRPGAPLSLEEAQAERGHGLEIRLRARIPREQGGLQLNLRGQSLLIRAPYDGSEGEVQVLKQGARTASQKRALPVRIKPDGTVELCILADRTLLEVFDSVAGWSMSIYHELPCVESEWQRHIELEAKEEATFIDQLDVYELNSTLPNEVPWFAAQQKLHALHAHGHDDSHDHPERELYADTHEESEQHHHHHHHHEDEPHEEESEHHHHHHHEDEPHEEESGHHHHHSH